MKSAIVKRSIVLSGHKTSVSLEDAFWRGLKDIATTRRTTLSDLIGSIDAERQQGNLSSALRLFVLNHYQARAARPRYEALCSIPSSGRRSWRAINLPRMSQRVITRSASWAVSA
jgi:predicted DNA-binding ribbon-helix-helix protein